MSFIVHEIKSTSTVRGITCHIPTFYERGTKSGRPRSKYGMEGRTDFKGKEPFCAISYLACQEEISRMGRSNGVAARLGSLDREVYSTLVTVMSSSTTTSSLLSSSPRHFLSHKILPFSDWEIGDRRLDNNRSARQEHKTQTGKAAARRAGGVEESGRTDGRTVRRRGGETRERERERERTVLLVSSSRVGVAHLWLWAACVPVECGRGRAGRRGVRSAGSVLRQTSTPPA